MSDKELTEEELIALAKKEETKSVGHEFVDDVQAFINDIGIVASTDHTDAMNIYWAYTRWCYAKKITAKNRRTFGREFSKYFERYNYERRKTYRVNKEPFILTEKEWFQMRRQLRLEQKNVKKKKK